MTEFTRFGFTGTSRGMSEAQKNRVRNFLSNKKGEFHHGDCIGADDEAHDIAVELGLGAVIHPPINSVYRAWKQGWITKGPLPYLDRNKVIVRSTEILIATPGEMVEQLRSGTWSTIRYARKLERPICIIYPNGNLRRE
jgi:predicted Rossmann fold nucleotide-binding protein DprA/Smf involved in DNA uptake